MISHRPARAFTLIEVLACILLFALGVTSVVAVIMQGMRIAGQAQGDATAMATALTVLKDPMPLGGSQDPATGLMIPWTWSGSGSTWSATEAPSGDVVWRYTGWSNAQASDLLIPDMGNPQANNPALFPPGLMPMPGCANGWINGYYVERREQSRSSDRISDDLRLVEVRVDVYWVSTVASAAQPLASVVDRFIRKEGGGP